MYRCLDFERSALSKASGLTIADKVASAPPAASINMKGGSVHGGTEMKDKGELEEGGKKEKKPAPEGLDWLRVQLTEALSESGCLCDTVAHTLRAVERYTRLAYSIFHLYFSSLTVEILESMLLLNVTLLEWAVYTTMFPVLSRSFSNFGYGGSRRGDRRPASSSF